jgi:hypothetical protein
VLGLLLFCLFFLASMLSMLEMEVVVIVVVIPVFKVSFVSLLPESHKRPCTYWLQRSAAEHSSTCHCIRYTQFAECTSTDCK